MESADDALYAPIRKKEQQEGDLSKEFRRIIEKIKKRYEKTIGDAIDAPQEEQEGDLSKKYSAEEFTTIIEKIKKNLEKSLKETLKC